MSRRRRNRSVLLRSQWCFRGRPVVVVAVYADGHRDVTCRVGRDRVDPAAREEAAAWLATFFPRLTHDERYAVLWGSPDE